MVKEIKEAQLAPRDELTELHGFCLDALHDLGVGDTGSLEQVGQRLAYAVVMNKIREIQKRER